MRLLETRTVSRKTPGDGRLEIARDTAESLGGDGATCRVRVGAADAEGGVTRIACTCHAAGGAHEHWFLESEVLRTLAPDARVTLSHDARGAVVVSGERPGP